MSISQDQVRAGQSDPAPLSATLRSAGLALYGEGQQTESFFVLFAAALRDHRQARYGSAAAALSTVVNLVQWKKSDGPTRQMMAEVLRKHQRELLGYPQLVTAGLRLAGLLGDSDWAIELASLSVRLQGAYSKKVGSSEAVTAGAVPSLVIAGFMKCATTSLYDFVSQQPWSLPAAAKEIGWLGAPWGQPLGAAFYKACFPQRAEGWADQPFSVDAYPRYISSDAALDALMALDPVPLTAVLVRDPFDRFVSHFEHDVRLGITRGHSSLAEYAEAIVAQLEDPVSNLRSRLGSEDAGEYCFPLSDSIYAPRIAKWLDRLGRNRLSVLDSSDLEKPAVMANWLRSFIGREGDPRIEVPVSNSNPSRKALAIDPGSALSVIRIFLHEANRDLPDIIGRKLPWAASS